MDELNNSHLVTLCQKLLTALQDCGNARREFLSWKSVRKETIKLLNKVANELDEHHRNANIAKITGNSVSVASGLLGITGALLLPFTMGLSSSLIAGSIIGGVAGGVTAGGTDFVEAKLINSLMKDAKESLGKDARNMKTIQKFIKSLSELRVFLTWFGDRPAFNSILFVFQEAKSCRVLITEELDLNAAAENIHAKLKGSLRSDLPLIPIQLVGYILNRIRENPLVLAYVMQISEFLRENPDELKNIGLATNEKKEWMATFGTVAEAGTKVLLGAKALGKAARAPMSRIAFGALGAAFLVVDTFSLVETAEDIGNGSLSNQARELRKVVQHLSNELENMEIFFRKLNQQIYEN